MVCETTSQKKMLLSKNGSFSAKEESTRKFVSASQCDKSWCYFCQPFFWSCYKAWVFFQDSHEIFWSSQNCLKKMLWCRLFCFKLGRTMKNELYIYFSDWLNQVYMSWNFAQKCDLWCFSIHFRKFQIFGANFNKKHSRNLSRQQCWSITKFLRKKTVKGSVWSITIIHYQLSQFVSSINYKYIMLYMKANNIRSSLLLRNVLIISCNGISCLSLLTNHMLIIKYTCLHHVETENKVI